MKDQLKNLFESAGSSSLFSNANPLKTILYAGAVAAALAVGYFKEYGGENTACANASPVTTTPCPPPQPKL